MPWIEFHPSTIVRLQKFRDFRVELGWSVNEALGFLGHFWGQVIDLREAGNIEGWKPDYIVELTSVKLAPEKLWDALVRHEWIDLADDGKVLLHDWLTYAGRYLKTRYKSKDQARLKEIYAMHGVEFKGDKEEEQPRNNPGTPKERPRALVGLGSEEGPVELSFKAFWTAYPRKVGKPAAWAAWKRLSPTPELLAAILAAVAAHQKSEQWVKDEGTFIPHPTTWLNQKRWEDEMRPAKGGGPLRPTAPEGKYVGLEEVV